MHKKYLIYIFLCSILIILSLKSVFSNYNEYKNLNSIQVYKNTNDYVDNKTEYLDKIYFLINKMKVFIEKIVYKNNGLSMEVRVLDKKNIYDIVDNLKKNNFDVMSYVCTSEENGIFTYAIEVEV